MSFEGANPKYLDHLLRAAIGGPGASEWSDAGELVAQLLLALVASTGPGTEELVETYLTPVPGTPVKFTVIAYAPGGTRVATEHLDLHGRAALVEAARLSSPGEAGITSTVEVIGVGDRGAKRRVLISRAPGHLCWLFPRVSEYAGPSDVCTEAIRGWAAQIALWSQGAENDLAGVGSDPARPPDGPERTASRLPPPASPDPPGTVSVMPSALALPAVAEVPDPGDRLPAVVADAIRMAMGDVAVEVDLSAIESIVREAIREVLDALRAHAAATEARDNNRVVFEAPPPDGDSPAELADRVATEVVSRRELADRVATEVVSRLELPDADGTATAIASRLPRASDIAAEVEQRLAALLSQPVAVKHDPADRAALTEATEAIKLQAERTGERLDAGLQSLDALAAELHRRDLSTAEATTELARKVEVSLNWAVSRAESIADASDALPVAIASALRSTLGDVTVKMDMDAVETVVRAAVGNALHTFGAQLDEAEEARERRRPVVEPQAALAPRVAAEVVSRLALPDPELTAAAVAARLPAAGDIAALVDERLAGRLRQLTDATHDQVDHAALAEAVEATKLQTELTGERLRAGLQSLETLATELHQRDRAAADAAAELARDIEVSLNRTVRRVESTIDGSVARHVEQADRLVYLIEELANIVTHLEPTGARPLDRPHRPPGGEGSRGVDPDDA